MIFIESYVVACDNTTFTMNYLINEEKKIFDELLFADWTGTTGCTTKTKIFVVSLEQKNSVLEFQNHSLTPIL